MFHLFFLQRDFIIEDISRSVSPFQVYFLYIISILDFHIETGTILSSSVLPSMFFFLLVCHLCTMHVVPCEVSETKLSVKSLHTKHETNRFARSVRSKVCHPFFSLSQTFYHVENQWIRINANRACSHAHQKQKLFYLRHYKKQVLSLFSLLVCLKILI